jgi:hypothetical protein
MADSFADAAATELLEVTTSASSMAESDTRFVLV